MPSKGTCIRSLSWMLKEIFHHSLTQQMFLESPQSAEASASDKVIPEGGVREMQIWL